MPIQENNQTLYLFDLKDPQHQLEFLHLKVIPAVSFLLTLNRSSSSFFFSCSGRARSGSNLSLSIDILAPPDSLKAATNNSVSP